MRGIALVALGLVYGCGPAWMKREPDSGRGPSVGSASASPPAADAAAQARMSFADPGGMWMPQQLDQHTVTLTSLGMLLSPAALTDPMAYPLGAVVYLGGCSASFVSPDGLMITNHHCATGALQYSSTPERNLMHDGFVARTRAEEKSNGPAARVYVTQAFRDVTAEVRKDLETLSDPKARYDAVEQREKQLVAACEQGRPELRCSVSSYFGGEKYMLVEQLEIRDVRLVYAPAEGIGNYGGEVDNWRWPRHSGDFSFFRAYVGPDRKPADHAAANVPYRPKHYLKIASKPLRPRDLVLVVGYPARTTRLKTAAEVKSAVDWYYPRRLRLCEDYLALLDRLAQQDEKLALKGKHLWRGLSNLRTNTQGMLDGLVRGGLKDDKERIETELRKWIGEHPEHAAAAQAIDDLARFHAEQQRQREQDAVLHEALFISTLLGAANTIVQMAEERPKPDADRDPRYQERNHRQIEQSQEQLQQSYARRLDQDKLALALKRAARLPKEQQPVLLGAVLGTQAPTEAAIDQALTGMYDKTSLEDAAHRVQLLRSASLEELKKSTDPFIVLVLKLRPDIQRMEDRDDRYAGQTMLARPRYVAALRASKDGVLAPDANGTLRISYGTVRGYQPTAGAPEYFPFTKLGEMVAKHTGTVPFDAPARLLEVAKSGPFEPYVAAEVGQVPVDFLSDLDITGGNSGSPTLDARGELVGLAFDGNYEAMASDWLFTPANSRAIHVDIRYVLWIMDRVDHADHLLREMGIEPHS